MLRDENDDKNQPHTNHIYTPSPKFTRPAAGGGNSAKIYPSNEISPTVVDTSKPREIVHDVQVKSSAATDSGHSSPSSSLDKHTTRTTRDTRDMLPTPLSTAKPRSRPKSQHIPRHKDESLCLG